MSAASVPRVLRLAAALIERDGWCQGTYIAMDGRCCAVGALVQAGDGVVDPDIFDAGPVEMARIHSAFDAAMKFIGRRAVSDLVDWNDEPDRTEAEVLAALRGAADAWEAEHG